MIQNQPGIGRVIVDQFGFYRGINTDGTKVFPWPWEQELGHGWVRNQIPWILKDGTQRTYYYRSPSVEPMQTAFLKQLSVTVPPNYPHDMGGFFFNRVVRSTLFQINGIAP